MAEELEDPLPTNSLPTNPFPTNPLGGFSPRKSRRGFLKGVLAGATLVIIEGATGLPGKVFASPEHMASSGTSPTQTGSIDVGRFQVATANFAKFTIRERDQTHALFNNTWGTPNEPHTAMIAGLSSGNTFYAQIAWDWPNPPASGVAVHGYHTIYHGLDAAAGVCTDSRFPFQISQHSALKLDIPNITVRGEGGWGLAFDVFLFKQKPFTLANAQAEIFIVLKRQAYDVPPQSDTVTSGGVTYAYGQWQAGQQLHVFYRRDNPAVPFRQQIDIYDFINYLRTKGIAQNANTLTMTDLGVEPIVGSGIFTLDSYYVTLS